MKKPLVPALVLFLAVTFGLPVPGKAQGTAFTYQGLLNSGSGPANGSYDIAFSLFATNTSGFAIAGPVTNTAVGVTNGLFTTLVDFGNVYVGQSNWLQIAVSTNAANVFSTLSPRQQLTPAPYAITAETVSGAVDAGALGGTYGNAVTLNNANNSFTGSFSGNGASVSNVNASSLNGVGATNFWQLKGNNVNAGNFLGSTNNQPVELWVNGARAFRLEPTTNDVSHSGLVNVVGGSAVNSVQPGTYGAVIGGGGATNYGGNNGGNVVAADLSVIGGGLNNSIQANSTESFLGGGYGNFIQSNAVNAVLVGGFANSIQSSGGLSPTYAFLGGGNQNSIQQSGINSFLGGGSANKIFTTYSFLGGGSGNSIEPQASDSVLVGGVNNSIQTNASASFIGGGGGNIIQINASSSVIGVGGNNIIQSNSAGSVIGGGNGNVIMGNPLQPSQYASIVGGNFNLIEPAADYSTIGGGLQNTIGTNNTAVLYATVPGGNLNYAGGNYSFAAGQRAKANFQGDFVWADSQAADFNSTSNDQFLVRAKGGVGINTGNPGTNALAVSGNINATSFSGNGAGLTGLNVTLAQLPPGVVTNNEPDVQFGFEEAGSLQVDTNLYLPERATMWAGFTAFLLIDNQDSTYLGLAAGDAPIGGSGNDNVGVGNSALSSVTIASYNVAIGSTALYVNKTNSQNVAVGYGGLQNCTNDSELVAVGYLALQNDNAAHQGTLSGFGENTAVGYQTLQADVTGVDNTAVGYQALNANTISTGNTALGYRALFTTTSSGGSENTAIGSGALANLGLGNGAGGGTNNVALGYGAGDSLFNGNDNIYIGNTGPTSGFAEDNTIRIGTQGLQTATYLAGTVYANGVALTSDRNAKENFQPVDSQAVLAKVAALPVTEWNYKDSKASEHMGPVAQDFQAAFGLNGGDDKHISVVDEGGVALAAIQGLNEKVEGRSQKAEGEIEQLRTENAELRARLEKLEELLARPAKGK